MVKVEYIGRLGNNLFQYCFGRILATKLDCGLQADLIPGFPGTIPIRRIALPMLQHEIIEGHQVDLESLLDTRKRRKIILRGFFQRYEYYQAYKNEITSWLSTDQRFEFDERDLTISIRAGDIWRSETNTVIHPDYCALPFSFYKSIIENGNWSNIHVVTEDADDPMVRKLAREYAVEVHSSDPMSDFNRLRSSANIVLSVGTFSWWAAWLSEATSIFYPLVGIMNPETRPDVNLIVDDEKRYQYRDIARVGAWTGTEEERKALLAG